MSTPTKGEISQGDYRKSDERKEVSKETTAEQIRSRPQIPSKLEIKLPIWED